MSSDAFDAEGYAERVARQIPGLRDLHRMVTILLAELVPADGRILVLGAGGGLELKAMADAQPEWRFDGVDPSRGMLDQARELLGPQTERIRFHEGYIDDAPDGPFDGAVCLLTLHFLPADERLKTLQSMAARMKPGAPLVTAHHSFPVEGGGKDRWLSRFAAFSSTAGPLIAMKEKLPVLPPEADEALLREAGFTDVELFWAAFTFKGWVSRRA